MYRHQLWERSEQAALFEDFRSSWVYELLKDSRLKVESTLSIR